MVIPAIRIVAKVGLGAAGTLGVTTAPNDFAGLLRDTADRIESGGDIETILWVLCIGLFVWAAIDVWRWRTGRSSPVAAEPNHHDPAGTVIVEGGGTVNIVEGDQHIHHHIHGEAEVITTRPLNVIYMGVTEHATGSAKTELVLTKEDGTVTVRKPDGDGA